ncbi:MULTISPECIES: hypothetical protein [unclassified Mesorhizobium]|uniref:hypothetical protein n=1 Tax=unclassified Mesorhizobium TaxID=325217 RepID=UPI0011283926|nr:MULTISPECIES: hypothetical protein [unclassified Mesorhizobium]TPK52901.1 hypothetical protein FJ550_14470 [Mesorhizobium sp. B2-5-2]TPL21333.1 hypothetical protein FJ946_21380 [Mesorhizobium sp. B2-4-7]TPL42946.1 hypothetical protein FJ961_09720 [Mesorhizobium sp. B2-4-5]TPM76925.1 hypothetical protein FJ968_04225 [Mesorhizobium sp. B2-1-6]TPN80043.1 hypothetical protein FJ985_02080 [Mesorhizobium sp. B1-1-2]
MALVITTCTNRKRKPVADSLRASSLLQANLVELAGRWCDRLALANARFPASQLYGGRAFKEATAAAQAIDARLYVVSAGLGLIGASTEVPSYACTVLLDADDSIAARVTGSFVRSVWWKELSRFSPFSELLRPIISQSDGLVCAALSDAYLDMISLDLVELAAIDRHRLRIFTRTQVERIAPELRDFVMPYDDRLDGPDSRMRGTRSDFASRALRHFVEHVHIAFGSNDAATDSLHVTAMLRDWRYPTRVERERCDDDAMRRLINEHWIMANGSTARLLRLFRDELNIACEQSRLARLVREVRAERS